MNQEPHQVLRPIIRHAHWDLLEKVLQNRLDMAMSAFKKCKPEDLGGIQGQVQELELLLGMKARLQADEKSRKK